MSTGERLKQRRLELGMTLEQVGDIVGVSKSTVRKWETGLIANMRRDRIALYAEALQVSPAFIIGVDEDEDPEAEVWELRQQLREQPGMQILFDAAKGVSKEDLEMAAEIVRRFKREAKGED